MWEFINESKPIAIVIGLFLLIVALQDIIKAIVALLFYFGLAVLVCLWCAGYFGWDTTDRAVVIASSIVGAVFTLLVIVNVGFDGLWSSLESSSAENSSAESTNYSVSSSQATGIPSFRPSWGCPVCGRESCSGHG